MKKLVTACTALVSALLATQQVQAAADVHVVPQHVPDHTASNGKAQPPVGYAAVWADDKGATHISQCRIEGLEFKSYAAPAPPQWIGVSPDQIESIAYAVLPPGYVGPWHHAPSPQWVITLQGQWSVETTDGSLLVQGPGEMQFNGDSTSKVRAGDNRVGHVTRTVGDKPNVQLIIKLKADTDKQQVQGPCAF